MYKIPLVRFVGRRRLDLSLRCWKVFLPRSLLLFTCIYRGFICCFCYQFGVFVTLGWGFGGGLWLVIFSVSVFPGVCSVFFFSRLFFPVLFFYFYTSYLSCYFRSCIGGYCGDGGRGPETWIQWMVVRLVIACGRLHWLDGMGMGWDRIGL
ncbi:hypothetical protein BZA05DRAFT_405236 [Tricharina praecox]|uniref:uncharacterized protein n=1 Tax=Tricharina praecox TaxID=43433 RepID=UPI002220073C|nr:uncharacterized protein BZA05DRAFT_405236 [Tricharina praecox]KAI5847572.1 hypothetical protein BZA05DRAFT_405236 [Tricharina praecox]